jgi:hypothetical protein
MQSVEAQVSVAMGSTSTVRKPASSAYRRRVERRITAPVAAVSESPIASGGQEAHSRRSGSSPAPVPARLIDQHDRTVRGEQLAYGAQGLHRTSQVVEPLEDRHQVERSSERGRKRVADRERHPVGTRGPGESMARYPAKRSSSGSATTSVRSSPANNDQ